MRIRSAILSGVLPMAIATHAAAAVLPSNQSNSPWYTDAAATTETKTTATTPTKAKNVILFVGDGMGVSTLTAARILQGQQNGNSGEEGYLSFETFPHTALVKTYNVDAQTPDSAGTMTPQLGRRR